MPSLTRDQLRDRLRRRELAPVYVLFGAETYLRDAAVRYISDLCFDDGDFRDFNDTEFSLAESDCLQDALAAAEQLPMMAKRRVIRVTDVRIALSNAKDTLKEDGEKVLLKYLERPSESTVLIFVAGELNGNRKLTKLLKDHALTVDFLPLNDAALATWTRDKIRDLGAEIGEPALRLLVSLVGSDLRRMTNEIAKLGTAALPGKQITGELIESLVAHTRELSNFELTDHLIAGRKGRAVQALKKILDDGVEPLGLLGLIAGNYRRLLAVKELMAEGADRNEVASAAKTRGQLLEAFVAAARRAESSRLTRAMRRVAAADLAIKTSIGGSGKKGARMQLEMLVCELAVD